MFVKVEEVTTKEAIEKLGSALSFVGYTPSQENLNVVFDWLKSFLGIKQYKAYIIKGSIFNKLYHLRGKKRYPKDLTIICIDQQDLTNTTKLATRRFEYDGKWLDDIVESFRM